MVGMPFYYVSRGDRRAERPFEAELAGDSLDPPVVRATDRAAGIPMRFSLLSKMTPRTSAYARLVSYSWSLA